MNVLREGILNELLFLKFEEVISSDSLIAEF